MATPEADGDRGSDRATEGAETGRLREAREGHVPWRLWGPYLSERQWGTVREDYSPNGDAWNYFTHDAARSRAYRWGEDGLAGMSDDNALLCFSLALWNGRDPILKERLFGLTNSEGNHGEDVKEYYFYLDSTPTHSYMRWLYKYPQAAYPYDSLVKSNKSRTRSDFEYELLDTGVFAENRYFDVTVEYAKAAPDDLIARITVANRGPESAAVELLPTLWFRNTWLEDAGEGKPNLSAKDATGEPPTILAVHRDLGRYRLTCEPGAELLFTDNETNTLRLSNTPNASPFVKDAFHAYVVDGRVDAVNPARTGTKAAARYRLTVPAGEERSVRLRLSADEGSVRSVGPEADAIVDARRREADAFYSEIIPASLDEDHARVVRQALAGMLWSKQFYHYNVDRWLAERGAGPFSGPRPTIRNDHWYHLRNADVISMPDKWEYPWYAAWDLAFHVLALTLVDPDFGKDQLSLILRDEYLHPNGQLPAYEWNFGDVNPPVHAWATIFTFRLEEAERGKGDVDWLERLFQKLLLNFTWWVNRKDEGGNNLFEGGFLGLDNIGVFDRSAPLPTGGHLEQADGTAWMALFCQNMLEIAAELAMERPAYVELAMKFVEHFLWISTAMMHGSGGSAMWDEEDGFFYDLLSLPDGTTERLRVRSMVGLLPLCAVTVFDGRLLRTYPQVAMRLLAFLDSHPDLREYIHDPELTGVDGRHMASILDEGRLRRVLGRMLDENEFLGEHGLRSLSKWHLEHPFEMRAGGQDYRVAYLPAESDTGMFGGNSNWRGPVWFPVNALALRALLQYYTYYGDDFRIECPTGSGNLMTLYEVAQELGRRLASIFLRDGDGHRPVFGGNPTFQDDPLWRDNLLFYEYFHGDNGAGLGASHQTGWTGIVARIIQLFEVLKPDVVLATALRWPEPPKDPTLEEGADGHAAADAPPPDAGDVPLPV
jgi:hypothetical protein